MIRTRFAAGVGKSAGKRKNSTAARKDPHYDPAPVIATASG
jgi:hypothetical protein